MWSYEHSLHVILTSSSQVVRIVCTRGVQITGTLSPVQLNFVWWRAIFRHNYCRISPLIKSSAYQFTCTEEKVPVNSDVDRSVLICDSIAYRSCLMSFLLAPVIWKWPVDFFKNLCTPAIRVLLTSSVVQVANVVCTKGYQILRDCGSHIKILGPGRVIWSSFNIEGWKTLGTAVKI